MRDPKTIYENRDGEDDPRGVWVEQRFPGLTNVWIGPPDNSYNGRRLKDEEAREMALAILEATGGVPERGGLRLTAEGALAMAEAESDLAVEIQHAAACDAAPGHVILEYDSGYRAKMSTAHSQQWLAPECGFLGGHAFIAGDTLRIGTRGNVFVNGHLRPRMDDAACVGKNLDDVVDGDWVREQVLRQAKPPWLAEEQLKQAAALAKPAEAHAPHRLTADGQIVPKPCPHCNNGTTGFISAHRCEKCNGTGQLES